MGQSTSNNKSNNNKNKSTNKSTKMTTSTSPLGTAFHHAIVLEGLSGSGKTTIQNQFGLKDSRVMDIDKRFLTTPQIYSTNYNKNTPRYGKMDEKVWQYGGRGSVRARWATKAYSTKAVVFVVDSTDRARLAPPADFTPLPFEFIAAFNHRSETEQAEILATLMSTMTAKSMLTNIYESYSIKRKPLLVLATKQDVEGAMTPEEICEALDLKSFDKVDWRIAGCDGLTGEGLAESIDWLNYVIENPTDFSKPKEPVPVEDEATRQQRWKDEYAVNQIKWELEKLERNKRDERFAKGGVFPAPPIYKTNGTLWKASEEDKATFVVAPLTVWPEDEVEKVEAAKLENPAVNLELAEKLIESIQVEEEVPAETSSPSPAIGERSQTPDDSSSSSSSSDNESEHSQTHSRSSSRASQTSEGHVSTHATTELLTLEPINTNDTLPNETLDVLDTFVAEHSLTKSKSKSELKSKMLTALTSAAIVLPPHAAIPTVPLVARKKHWYSRKEKLLPMENYGQEDIHKIDRSFYSLI